MEGCRHNQQWGGQGDAQTAHGQTISGECGSGMGGETGCQVAVSSDEGL